ncbi:hypothetical protein BASA50_005076, partial [Batrachochytrium salamandrivorans]
FILENLSSATPQEQQHNICSTLSRRQSAVAARIPIQPLRIIHQTDNMKLISFAVISLLAITASAYPHQDPNEQDSEEPQGAASQSAEQPQGVTTHILLEPQSTIDQALPEIPDSRYRINSTTCSKSTKQNNMRLPA